jgi:hypothetical protein
MKTYTYVDNSNVYIEGSRIAAVKKGDADSIYDAMNRFITNTSWQLDYGKLHMFLCGDDKTRTAFGGRDTAHWGTQSRSPAVC